MTTVGWTTYNRPETLVNVGIDAIAMLCDNIVCLTDLRKRNKAYYKADNATMGAGISLLVGHNRFPLFAFVEAVLQPSIHIIKYPEMTKLAVFKTVTNTTYADVCFSENDFLVAITGYPYYILRVWNFRTKQLIAQEATYIRCSAFSLICSTDNIPRIVQYSIWTKELVCWEMCSTEDDIQLHEILTISLPKNYSETMLFLLCFADDGNLYIVNDYGCVSSVEVGQLLLKLQWSSPSDTTSRARRHSIYSHKQGLLVANAETVHFIKKNVIWAVEWTVRSPNENVHKIISTFNNEVYSVNKIGNLYRIDVEGEKAAFVDISTTNQYILDFVILSGIKEETTLMLNTNGDLRLVEILRMYQYSTLTVENASSIGAHNVLQFVAVSTSAGNIHFISYEKLRAPITLAVVEIGDIRLTSIHLLDNVTLVLDADKSFYMVLSNFETNEFILGASTEPERSVHVQQFFLYNEEHFIAFVARDTAKHMVCAKEAWNYQWLKKQKSMRRTEFDLPYQYCDFTLTNVGDKDSVDFYGIRLNDTHIDGFCLSNNGELVLSVTIKTTHSGNLTGIQSTRNLMTWGVDGIVYHFRIHKKSSKPYNMTRWLQTNYSPRIMRKVVECYNGKFLAMLNVDGTLTILKLGSMSDNLHENTIEPDTHQVIEPKAIVIKEVQQTKGLLVRELTTEELESKANVLRDLKALGEEVSKLIDYDISVTGKTQGAFRKFCLNFKWLAMLNEEARILFDAERKSLMGSVADQSRIRDWIMNLIGRTTAQFGIKLRAIFSNVQFESYGIPTKLELDDRMFDLYRFYDMDGFDEDNEMADEAMDEQKATADTAAKVKNRWVVQGSAFEHAMAEEFAMQDTKVVTSNQMHNDTIKFTVVLESMLKAEFNKQFAVVQKFKQEIIDNIIGSNAELKKIYSNMNCMLCLLKMDTFMSPELSAPEWMKDEVLERILTVDDSEIKAINRRNKKKDVAAYKGGRMLLWNVEFWVRALNVMMDGVLEKLWEEEIKKELPVPEFILKKQDHEYTLEDQKQLREYQEKLHLLAEDRRKYLRILNDGKKRTLDLKANHILKLNEKIAETALLKQKYDFAMKQGRISILNTKINSIKRSRFRKHVLKRRADIAKNSLYINIYTKLTDFWEKSMTDIKLKLDLLTIRDKNIEKDFKGKYLNSIPANLIPEMNKLFKRRPKVLPKSVNSTLMYMEVASHVIQKSNSSEFPLPSEVAEYWKALDMLDDIKTACPIQLEPKYWESFVKLRRHKIESELKIKGMGLQFLDAQKSMNTFARDVATLKSSKVELTEHLEKTISNYLLTVRNRQLQITLSMGQVEIALRGSLVNLSDSILMNLDDVNEVNELIRKAGAKKLKAMEKVALFRRQIIFKEWEHKVIRANIDYLQYMLQVIEKCNISMEFLQILRNWKKVKAEKAKTANAVGLIEHVIEQKIAAFRKNLVRIIEQIAIVKLQIDQERRKSQQINKKVSDVKVNIAISTANRDFMVEEKFLRERNEKMAKIKDHRSLIDNVRRDYAHVLELNTILELQRLRTYPTLGPAPPECT